jgi:FAD/FMN-containing dehydrogenase
VRETKEEIQAIANQVEADMRAANLGYHFPLLFGEDSKKIWTLRKAGLGLLSNLPGDEKAVPVIEDTAVDVQDLPAYIRDFNLILEKHGLYSVHYAHAGSGELHLRPIINLKTKQGQRLFRTIAEEIATLVKKYNGSLSGEHGDGRLRGEFIRQMVGDKNYQLLRKLKSTWDPNHIFNPGKIVDTPPMDTMLRYTPDQSTPVGIGPACRANRSHGLVGGSHRRRQGSLGPRAARVLCPCQRPVCGTQLRCIARAFD